MKFLSGMTGKHAFVVLVLFFLITVVSGFIGVDYGKHWDEFYVSQGLSYSIQTLTFIPFTYFYSGMYFNVGYAALGYDLVEFLSTSFQEVKKSPSYTFNLNDYPVIMNAQKALVGKARSTEFKLRLRRMYIVFSALSIFVLYFAIRWWRSGYIEPLVGAGLIALSWEVNYHSRHIAVDNMMMVFGALVLLCAIRYSREKASSESLRWLLLGSIAAGLAAGSKIIGFLLVVPLLASVFLYRGNLHVKAILTRTALVFLVMLGTLFVVSPGLFLDPVRVVHSFTIGFNDYADIGSAVYNTHSFIGNVALTILYYIESALSPYRFVSLVFSVFSLVGLVSIFREDRRMFIVFISFPLINLLVFSDLKLLIVRNFLVVLPFIAVAASRGIGETFKRFSGSRFIRYALGGFLICWAVLNTAWMFNAAASVRPYSMQDSITAFSEYLKENPENVYFLSPGILREMDKAGFGALASQTIVNADKGGDAFCAFLIVEHTEGKQKWQAYRRGFFEKVIGSFEVNYDYYPLWIGHNYRVRIHVLTPENANIIGYNCGAPG